MNVLGQSEGPHSGLISRYAGNLLLLLLLFGTLRPAFAIPAFARKTGLRCSACHEAWPKLNNFGQTYMDNGFQIGNERDGPVYQSPYYWPVSIRMTPNWHTELNTATSTDQAVHGVQAVSVRGFDLSGMDLWFAGLLAKNISFVVLPSSDEYASFRFESAWLRFDNLLTSPWLNLKVGRFELDQLISEKRMLTLSTNGSFYQIYHYLPSIDPHHVLAPVPGETGVSATSFGLGDNQLGTELMGHSRNNYTQYSASLLSSSDGTVNLPSGKSFDSFFSGSQAFNAGSLGLQQVGAFNYHGQSSTSYLTQTSAPGNTIVIPGSGFGNKPFMRTGVFGIMAVKNLLISPMFTHATESAYVALGIPAVDMIPVGIHNPAWNGRMLELNYTPTLQFVVTTRYEDIRNTKQIFQASTAHYGDLDAETISFRYYPFMTSRDGLAIHTEYSKVHSIGVSAVSGNQTTRSGLIGLDFAF